MHAAIESNIAMVFSDVDGTLVDGSGAISPSNCRAVRRVARDGVPFVLISGRPLGSLRHLATFLPEVRWLIACNGGVVYDTVSQRVVWTSAAVGRATLTAVLGTLRAVDVSVAAYGARDWYVQTLDDRLSLEAHRVGSPPKLVDDLAKLPESVLKLLCVAERSTLDDVRVQLAPWTHSLRPVQTYYDDYLDIIPRHVSKANAARVLCEITGTPPEAILALGDGHNDIELFDYAGTSVAVPNACEPLARLATLHVRGSHTDAVAAALDGVIYGVPDALARLSPGCRASASATP